ncbi:MAG: efflux RND transporter periplasmic adaptor subunit [Tannerella sp.]|nr:efflux RND transporter periplasmic adaptor subunit [Tannerella sp.]
MTGRGVLCGLALAAGIAIGGWLFGGPADTPRAEETHLHAEAEPTVWTCSMHPQIRQDKPGKCPLCAMDLIPLKPAGAAGNDATDPDAVLLSEEAAALANIQTTVVTRSRPEKEIRLYGVVQPDEQRIYSLASPVSGRIETLHVRFEGETVHRGDVVAGLYSPDLLNAQQELLEALGMASVQPALPEAAREKLRRWKLTGAQIAAIEQRGTASPVMDITASGSGVVTAKNVEEGDYVTQGSVLFKLADFSSVWVMFEAYETDLSYLKAGDRVTYTLPALPGKTFEGKITFIDPTLDKLSRTARVRVETANPGLQLKPEMYASAVIRAAPAGRPSEEIVIPRSAVLWTGKRSVVYVRQPDTSQPTFHLREVELGATLGETCIIASGIAEGEEVVTNGAFTIDASAQLEGKRSMMNGAPSATPAGEEAALRVEGLCEMCRERIEDAARKVPGVTAASWDMETRQLHVRFDARQTSADAVARAVAAVGHDTAKYKAGLSVYTLLPDCCKYRN